MERTSLHPFLIFLIVFYGSEAIPKPENIEHILVTCENSATPTSEELTQQFSEWSVSTLSTAAKMNPYHIIQFSPSVNFTPVDIAGSNEPAFHDPIRIRGKSQSGPGGVYLINGAPISSNPGGGKQLIDMENTSAIDLYKSYIPSSHNNGFSSLIGKIDIKLKEPAKNQQYSIALASGSDDFSRIFLRADSAKIANSGIFASFSNIQSRKYKGDGNLKRTNAMLGADFDFFKTVKLSIYALHNKDEHHNYRSYSFDELQSDNLYSSDFSSTKPTTDNNVDYFDWNKQSFNTNTLISDLSLEFTPRDTVAINMYGKKDWGEYWNSQTNSDANKNRVIVWDIDHKLYGSTISYIHEFSNNTAVDLGYWFHRQQPPGPPTNRKKYRSIDGELVFDGYAVLAEADYHEIKSPFIEFSGIWQNFELVAGIKYQTFLFGSFDSHTQSSNGDTSPHYQTAIADTPSDQWSSVSANKQTEWLPSLYMAYTTDSDNTFYTSFTRSYGFDVNVLPTYIKKRNQFVTKDITLQQLWDKTHVETSDNVDIGYRFSIDQLNLQPSLYYSEINNKQANIYDANIDASYPANIGHARAYGAELSVSGKLTDQLTLISGLSYNRFAFTENFQSGADTVIATKNKQVPDAPKVMSKTALSYTSAGWTITPSIRYSSYRQGDLLNIQRIESYFVSDLDIAYCSHWGAHHKAVQIKVSISNLTDRRYISTIIAADNVLSATATASTYQPGAPRQLYASVSMEL